MFPFSRQRVFIITVVSLLFCGAFLSASADEKPAVFRAGAATSNITPPLGGRIVGSFEPIYAEHIHDELHARCIVLDDGKCRLGIVLCDSAEIPAEVFDAAKAEIQKLTGIPASHLLMASTHTHSATAAGGRSLILRDKELNSYQEFLIHRISDGVRRAIHQLEPARIGWGQVDEPSELFNRRWFVTDPELLKNPFGGTDQVRMNPPQRSTALVKPAGPVDPQISFVSIQSTQGRPIALLANYSLHYVGGVPIGDVSADYFGYFAKYIGEKLGAADQDPPFVGILSNGTSGDVNNTNVREEGRRRPPYERIHQVAEKISSRVFEAHQAVVFHDDVSLDARLTLLPLRVRKPTPEMLAYFAKLEDKSNPATDRTGVDKFYAKRIALLAEATEEIQAPIQVLRIGDLGIAGIPFETFAETGLRIKSESPFKSTFTIELANGSFGYLPTPEQHRLGGYETWLGTNFVEEEASSKIAYAISEMFRACAGK